MAIAAIVARAVEWCFTYACAATTVIFKCNTADAVTAVITTVAYFCVLLLSLKLSELCILLANPEGLIASNESVRFSGANLSVGLSILADVDDGNMVFMLLFFHSNRRKSTLVLYNAGLLNRIFAYAILAERHLSCGLWRTSLKSYKFKC